MPSAAAPYSRVYWGIVDDPKFASIYDNDRHLATWLRLLLIADQAHPASATLPSGVSRAAVVALSDAGLVSLGTGSRFRISGLDKERAKRSESARNAAALRWESERTAERMPRRDETRRAKDRQDEQSTAEPSLDEQARENPDGREDLEAFVLVKRRAPTEGQRHLLDRVIETHDESGPAWAANIILSNPRDPIGAVIEADKRWRSERIAAAKVAERKTPQPRRRSGLPESARELVEHWAAEKRREQENGAA